MRLRFILLSLLLSPWIMVVAETADSLFLRLDEELAKKRSYELTREKELDEWKAGLKQTGNSELLKQYQLCLKIYDTYKSYQFDSAYTYVARLEALSTKLNDRSKIYGSKVKLGFILLSSGMFKEAFDSVREIDAAYLSREARKEYFGMLTRAYFDLAGYDSDKYFAPRYNELANIYVDSVINLCVPGSFDRISWEGYKELKRGNHRVAAGLFTRLIEDHPLSEHEFAIAASTLSTIHAANGNKERAQELLIRAAMADIRSATKETLALFWLSESLLKEGDIERAYRYISEAMEDAEYYGARQRKLQIGTVLPIIAAAKVNNTEREKKLVRTFLIFALVLSAVIAVFSVLLYKQLQKLKVKERIIEETNAELELINQQLIEGTAIKEGYIGYFFNVISEYILKLERLKHSVEMKLNAKRYNDIPVITAKINIKKERETLYNTFDHVFLRIFPNFIPEFNKLFKPEDQMWPKANEVLTTDLRIFALIRMGIEDDATIAKVLEYSEKTIYVYKMRIKAKALVHGDDFKKRLMAIKAVNIEKRESEEPYTGNPVLDHA